MKFTMTSKILLDALNKMHRISTKGIKHEYEMAGRVTFLVEPDKVTFKASNGHLFANREITKTTDSNVSGDPNADPITADVTVLKKVVKAVSANNGDAVLTIMFDGKTVIVQDVENKKRRAKAKIETFHKHHDFVIRQGKKGFSYTFPIDLFKNGITVGKYASRLNHKIKYQMICLHFLPDELRFVCGNGLRFGILSYKAGTTETPATGVAEKEGVKYIIPADQAAIIGAVVDSSSQKMTIRYESETSCFINPFDGMEMHLKGIPNESFIPYEDHVDGRDNEIEAILDVEGDDYVNCIELVNAVKDQKAETEGNFHSATFKSGEHGELEIKVDEGRFQCEFSCPANYTNVQNRKEFSSMYAASFLTDVADAVCGREIVRFSCIDEYGTILVEPRSEKNEDDPRLTFFFASALERDKDDDSAEEMAAEMAATADSE